MSDSSNGGPSKSRSKSPPRLKDEDSNIRRQRASESGIVRHPEHPSFRWVGQADAIIEPVDILMYKQDAKRGTLSEFTSLERNGETMEFAWQEREFQQHVDFHLQKQRQVVTESIMVEKSKAYARQVSSNSNVKKMVKEIAKEDEAWCSNNLRPGSQSSSSDEEKKKPQKPQSRIHNRTQSNKGFVRNEVVKKDTSRGFFVGGVIQKENSGKSVHKAQSFRRESKSPAGSSSPTGSPPGMSPQASSSRKENTGFRHSRFYRPNSESLDSEDSDGPMVPNTSLFDEEGGLVLEAVPEAADEEGETSPKSEMNLRHMQHTTSSPAAFLASMLDEDLQPAHESMTASSSEATHHAPAGPSNAYQHMDHNVIHPLSSSLHQHSIVFGEDDIPKDDHMRSGIAGAHRGTHDDPHPLDRAHALSDGGALRSKHDSDTATTLASHAADSSDQPTSSSMLHAHEMTEPSPFSFSSKDELARTSSHSEEPTDSSTMGESLAQNEPLVSMDESPSAAIQHPDNTAAPTPTSPRVPHPPPGIKVPFEEDDSAELRSTESPRHRMSKLSPLSPLHVLSPSPATMRYLSNQSSASLGSVEEQMVGVTKSQSHGRTHQIRDIRANSASSDGGAIPSASNSPYGSAASPSLSPLNISQSPSRPPQPSQPSRWEYGRPRGSPVSTPSAPPHALSRSLLAFDAAQSFELSSSPYSPPRSSDGSPLSKDGHRTVNLMPSQPSKLSSSVSMQHSRRLRTEQGRLSSGGGGGGGGGISSLQRVAGSYQRHRNVSDSGSLTSLTLSNRMHPDMRANEGSFTEEASRDEESERTSFPNILRPAQVTLQAQRLQSGGLGDAQRPLLPTIQPQLFVGSPLESGRISAGGWTGNLRKTKTEGGSGWRGG